MFGSLPILIAIIALAMLSAGGLAYSILYRRIETENRVAQRIDQIRADRAEVSVARDREADAAKRRKSVQETLKDLEDRQKALAKRSKSPPLKLRMEQAGLSWSRRTFFIISAVCGLVITLVLWIVGLPLYTVAAFGLFGLLALPRMIVNFMRKRRMKKFLVEFPNAVDIIVRGVKAGLPLNDCIRIISVEAAEPVRSEFRTIVETQSLGVPIGEAVAKMPERVPVPEANFFAIVIAIQSKAGGNLSEALGNLSRVLRERKKMEGKIQAMSMEAKASGAIIGALPIVVMGLVYMSSPSYIRLLFTDPIGNVILGCSLVWMLVGIFVMRKMINFDF